MKPVGTVTSTTNVVTAQKPAATLAALKAYAAMIKELPAGQEKMQVLTELLAEIAKIQADINSEIVQTALKMYGGRL